MVPTRPARRRSTRIALVATAVVTVLLGASSPAAAQATGALGKPAVQPPDVPGLAQVARPTEARPAPLPKRAGSVKVVKPAKPARAAAAAAGLNDQVALRALVIGTDANDFGVATWKTTLDRVGASYDVLYDATTPLTTSTLVRPDGVGRYNAILLTNSMQVYESNGSYLSGLDPAEWNILWAYERNFGVRQAALYTSYGTWPENYCLTSNGETGVGSTPINLSLTATGAGVFDYLKSTAQIPLVQSYVYRTSITPGCGAEATITNGSDVLGVRTTSTDGRERLALTFTSNQYLTHSDLLVYGMLRWASKGMFLGEQRHHLNVDIDDWFNTSDHYYPDGHVEYTPGFQVTGHDTVNLDNQQTALRAAHPQAADFKLNIAFNGADIDPFAGNACSPNGGIAELTATTKCLKDKFRWVNHTLNHPELNNTSYATSYAEINDNRAAGNAIGLSSPDSVLKTPEYSGLGVYNPNPDDDTSPPVDHGLTGSNPELLRAAKDLNVKYLHGNMSFASHVPANLNAAKVHPLEPSISVVPDWPTNIAYFVTTPQEETAFYNSFYGPNGRFPYWPTNLTYEQIIDYEAGVALGHVSSGAIYSHTFHIGNVRDYGAGKTLLTDWIDAVMTKYEGFYSVPLLNQDWPALAAYTSTRTAHFAQLGAGVDPVYDRSTGTITVTSPAAGTVQISGAQGTGASTYGTDVTTTLALAANTAVTVTAVPHL
ncbi:hypothetical protein AB0C12_05805 [Actinoplanes sp. NPDC048967]|uniref:Agd3-related carbohydrate-binding protein n=1 Tax=Actinoplanes sp. NPDC048967 TaxID=3155269 RepID=UPI0033FCA4C7